MTTTLHTAQRAEFYRLTNELAALSEAELTARIDQIADGKLAELLRLAYLQPAPACELKAGADFAGRYQLLYPLGSGGCGQVWLAHQDLTGTNRQVAIKFIHPRLLSEGGNEFAASLQQDVQALAEVSAAGIVQLIDAGETSLPGLASPLPFMVMEWVRGGPINGILRGEPAARQVGCFLKVCEAVQLAHRKGIFHLDLKPDNVLVLDQGGVFIPKVLDFGLSRRIDPNRTLIRALLGRGTLPYTAPEQLAEEFGGVVAQTDVHALGVLLFKTLTGRLPFNVPDGNREKLQAAICGGERMALRKASARLDAHLEEILAGAICLEPAERYRSPAEFAEALREWLQVQGSGGGSRPSPSAPPPPASSPEVVMNIGTVHGKVTGVEHIHGDQYNDFRGVEGTPAKRTPPASPAGSSPPRSRGPSPRGGGAGPGTRGNGVRGDGLPEHVFEEQVFPAGKFKLGKTGEICPIARPYRIARYPVTVAQYEPFKAVGYDEQNPDAPRWWGPEGWRWKLTGKITGPEDYDPVFQTPNHPRVGVSWYEAKAFCAWASEQLRLTIRLPHEAEWEQSARWNGAAADARTYPWGESEEGQLARCCNCGKTALGHTSPVGSFPLGRAVCGAMDMAGNVWEWCENLYQPSGSSRVLRGGSWYCVYLALLSCSYRRIGHPGLRSQYGGFRCVLVGEGSA